MVDFDQWRASYDSMSYEDQVAFYDKVWDAYPVQMHFDADAAARFFEYVTSRNPSVAVAEVGGWRGELADIILRQHSPIGNWRNTEICRGAVHNPVPTDFRYEAEVPDKFIWDLELDFSSQVLVLSHVIEHMRAGQMETMISRHRAVEWVFIASPLQDDPVDWSGYDGSHIIEVGWDGIRTILARHRLFELPGLRAREVRCFVRLPEVPKVSIIVPTYNRTDLLMSRTIPSILAQTDPDWEAIVVGDGTEQATEDAMNELCGRDPRFSFMNLPHYDYSQHEAPEIWGIIGLPSLNWGLDHARGEWIAVLADDDAYTPEHNELLVREADARGVDFLYGVSVAPWGQRWGAWPPGDGQLANGAYVYRGAAKEYRYDMRCIADRGRTGDADMWIRMFEGGVTFAMIDDVVHHYFPSSSR